MTEPRSESLVGVIGVGRMGSAVLAHLARASPVAAFDVDGGREHVVRATGSRWFPDLLPLVRQSSVLVTVLPGPDELRAVMEAALPQTEPGTLWIDMTSGDPGVTAELTELAALRGVECLAAPIGGSVEEANAGALTFFTGGTVGARERAAPLLDVLSAPGGIRHAGDRPQDGQLVKLLANALWFANAVAASEAMLVGQSWGLGTEHLLELLRASAGGSTFLDRHADHLLDGDYMETFGIDRVVVELDTVSAAARSRGVPTPILDASDAVHRAALARFGPALGELLGARLIEEEAGHELRRDGSADGDGDGGEHAPSR